jgi:hypothetical protein
LALPLEVRTADGVQHLVGVLDERVKLALVVVVPPDGPLKLNLQGIRAVNSLGLRGMMDFMAKLEGREVELHEVSAPFVEAVNTLPEIVGGQEHVDRIKSLMLPLTCFESHATLAKVAVADLEVAHGVVTLPRQACRRCGQPLVLENGMQAEDYLFFLVASD